MATKKRVLSGKGRIAMAMVDAKKREMKIDDYQVMKDERELLKRHPPATKEVLDNVFAKMGITRKCPIKEINKIVDQIKGEENV